MGVWQIFNNILYHIKIHTHDTTRSHENYENGSYLIHQFGWMSYQSNNFSLSYAKFYTKTTSHLYLWGNINNLYIFYFSLTQYPCKPFLHLYKPLLQYLFYLRIEVGFHKILIRLCLRKLLFHYQMEINIHHCNHLIWTHIPKQLYYDKFIKCNCIYQMQLHFLFWENKKFTF